PTKTDAAQPTGGDEITSGGAAADKKEPLKLQAQDPDDPGKMQAKEDAAAAAAAQAALVAKAAPPPGPPFYKRWKFWAVTGAVVVGVVALAWGGSAIAHAANGGDVKACPAMNIGCFGEGRCAARGGSAPGRCWRWAWPWRRPARAAIRTRTCRCT
ncbi:MAG TPA: hypothetical protein VMU50_07355, partial [Polyangia bacterium]|nr:hypothetical protein [Polyangia bacterium]